MKLSIKDGGRKSEVKIRSSCDYITTASIRVTLKNPSCVHDAKQQPTERRSVVIFFLSHFIQTKVPPRVKHLDVLSNWDQGTQPQPQDDSILLFITRTFVLAVR